MDLNALLGQHKLSGAEYGTLTVRDWLNREEDRAVLFFVLDGVTIAAEEDDNDGYRSSLGALHQSDHVVTNTFAPVAVVGTHRSRGEYSDEDDVVELRDATTGALVLEVGTRNIDDYYPSFVGFFYPEAMAVNKEVSE